MPRELARGTLAIIPPVVLAGSVFFPMLREGALVSLPSNVFQTHKVESPVTLTASSTERQVTQCTRAASTRGGSDPVFGGRTALTSFHGALLGSPECAVSSAQL